MHSCNLTFDLLKNQAIKPIKNDSTGNIDNGYAPINVMPLPNWGRPCNQIPLKKSGSDWGFDFYSLTMQSEVIKFPIIGSLSSVKPSSNPHQLPSRGVVGHNIDRHINYYPTVV